MPATVTHVKRLAGTDAEVMAFLAGLEPLGARLGVVLVQLPGSFAYDERVAERFFADLRQHFPGQVACEPRHATWFEADADRLLIRCRIARVAADPARVPAAALPGGWPGLAYFRWHGSPRMYRSGYTVAQLATFRDQVVAAGGRAEDRWCVFDNTTEGAAAADALALEDLLAR